MSLQPSFEEQELIADTLRRVDGRVPASERRSDVALSLLFAAATAALWLLRPPSGFAAAPAVLCLLVLVVASRVRFDTPFGFTVATQVAFVPLLFSMPVALAPLATVLALMLARLPQLVRGRSTADRLLKDVVNAMFALGPVAVFAVLGIAPARAGAAVLIGALLAQFAVDIVVSSVRFRLERKASIVTQLSDLWVYGIDAALSVIALVIAEELHRNTLVALAPLPLLWLLAMFARERHARVRGLVELNAAYRGTALVLGDVIEADDGYTGEHCRGVVRLAMAVGESLGLTAEQRRDLEFGALLHDVGKIAIPKEIINKPGKLDPDEWRIMVTHTIEGQAMLDRIGGFMRGVGLIVRSHHERWDGAGYPDGLAGESIPLEARIVACCDSWNAMRTDRPYRGALSYEVARAELEANAGTQFDPRIAAVFLDLVDADERAAADDRADTDDVPAGLDVVAGAA